ncbi:glycosyl hydrolase family 8 [Nocardioides ultimimeridianus]
MTRRILITGGALLVGAVLGVGLDRAALRAHASDPTIAGTPRSAPTVLQDRAHAFLQRYVDATGRVVRLDQGGDTVSEGQAYAMLIAVGVRAQGTFDRVWQWTRTNLRRPDGLLAWHWADGSVTDQQSAADADLDTARALVLAGRAFGRSGLVRSGTALGTAILREETVSTPVGRLLLPGSWADHRPPYLVDPSYFSPVSARVLYGASRDPRWRQLAAGGRAVLRRLATPRRLVPDWATVAADGTARPALGPSGEPVVFGFDAARAVVRLAESCTAADRAIAAGQQPLLTRYPSAYGITDLAGLPLVDYATSLAWVSRAAALRATGRPVAAAHALDAAGGVAREFPTYYGDAWEVLGRLMLTTRRLGGCAQGVAA